MENINTATFNIYLTEFPLYIEALIPKSERIVPTITHSIWMHEGHYKAIFHFKKIFPLNKDMGPNVTVPAHKGKISRSLLVAILEADYSLIVSNIYRFPPKTLKVVITK